MSPNPKNVQLTNVTERPDLQGCLEKNTGSSNLAVLLSALRGTPVHGHIDTAAWCINLHSGVQHFMCSCFLFPFLKELVRSLCNCTTAGGGEVAQGTLHYLKIGSRAFFTLCFYEAQTSRQEDRWALHMEEFFVVLSPAQDGQDTDFEVDSHKAYLSENYFITVII